MKASHRDKVHRTGLEDGKRGNVGHRSHGDSAASSDAAHKPWPSAVTGREFGQADGHQRWLVQQLLQPQRRRWLWTHTNAAEGVGLSDIAEQGFCEQQWLLHFNQATTSNTLYATVADDDVVGQECRELVRQLGESPVRSLRGARADAGWGSARPPEGWQVSLGGTRSGHVDPSHLGHLILTVTLEGDCEIGVQRQRGEPAPPEDDGWEVRVQRQYDYYAIWGGSIAPHKIKHRVGAGRQLRLSITMRFVNAIPRALPRSANGERQWNVGDVCCAFWQRRAWYLGRVSAVAPDRSSVDVRYEDGDCETRLPTSRLRPAVGATAVAIANTQRDRRERYARRQHRGGSEVNDSASDDDVEDADGVRCLTCGHWRWPVSSCTCSPEWRSAP